MKVTRFINGKKLDGTMSGNIVINNDVINETISKANDRAFVRHTKSKNISDLNG
ncbi:MAG: hypothetical protein IJ285_00455 [Clostridia bacterium]|nr:hypothetical protein [Clostridia bacterium]